MGKEMTDEVGRMDGMSEGKRTYPTGGEVVIQPGDPMHPGGDSRPAIAMTICVSAADQEWMDNIRARSAELAVQRGHVRRMRA